MIYNKKCQIGGQCLKPTDWVIPLNCSPCGKISDKYIKDFYKINKKKYYIQMDIINIM